MAKYLLLSIWFVLLSHATFAQAKDTIPDQFAQVGDVKIHYKIYGKGEPVFLLHGSLESMKDWSKQVPDFSKHYKVITIDNRGHGMSTFTDRKMDYALLS